MFVIGTGNANSMPRKTSNRPVKRCAWRLRKKVQLGLHSFSMRDSHGSSTCTNFATEVFGICNRRTNPGNHGWSKPASICNPTRLSKVPKMPPMKPTGTGIRQGNAASRISAPKPRS